MELERRDAEAKTLGWERVKGFSLKLSGKLSQGFVLFRLVCFDLKEKKFNGEQVPHGVRSPKSNHLKMQRAAEIKIAGWIFGEKKIEKVYFHPSVSFF